MCCFEQQISNGSFIFEKKSAHLRKFHEGQQWTACRRPPRLCVSPWGGIEEQKEGQHKNTPCPRRGAGPSIYRQGPGVCLDVLRPHSWPPSSFPAQAHLLTWHLNWGGAVQCSPRAQALSACPPSLSGLVCLLTVTRPPTLLHPYLKAEGTSYNCELWVKVNSECFSSNILLLLSSSSQLMAVPCLHLPGPKPWMQLRCIFWLCDLVISSSSKQVIIELT